MLQVVDGAETRRRMPRLLLGLVMCGTGVALMVAADLGLSPWDVLHQGGSKHTGIPIGTVGILVGVAVLLCWIPLGERPGVGTICNVIVIGGTIDLVLLALPDDLPLGRDPDDAPGHVPVRARVRPLHRRSPRRRAPGRADDEPGGAGLLRAGGAHRARDRGARDRLRPRRDDRRGTMLFAVTIGPNVHYFLERWDLGGGP